MEEAEANMQKARAKQEQNIEYQRRIRTTDFICDKIKAICEPRPEMGEMMDDQQDILTTPMRCCRHSFIAHGIRLQ